MNATKLRPYLMWILALSFFAFQFILRIWPSQVMPDIINRFNINISSFGLLASCYYWGYALFQIPIAILLSRYGSKIILFSCCLICGIATVLFSYTDIWLIAVASRFLIGATSAAGFLGVSHIVTEWFLKKEYSKMIGLSFSFGLLGAVYGGKPISLLIEKFSSTNVSNYLGMLCIALAVCIMLFLKDKKDNVATAETVSFAKVKYLFNYPLLWILGIANLFMVGTLEGFADVWGINFLISAALISKSDAAGLVSFIFIGMLFGGPILACFSKKFGEFHVIILSSLVMALIFVPILLLFSSNHKFLAFLFFISGIFCCYQVLIFSVGRDLVKKEHQDITVALLNALNMMGGSFFHTIIGFCTELFSKTHCAAQYINSGDSVCHSQTALLIIPISSIIGGMMIFFVKRKSMQQQYKANFP